MCYANNIYAIRHFNCMNCAHIIKWSLDIHILLHLFWSYTKMCYVHVCTCILRVAHTCMRPSMSRGRGGCAVLKGEACVGLIWIYWSPGWGYTRYYPYSTPSPFPLHPHSATTLTLHPLLSFYTQTVATTLTLHPLLSFYTHTLSPLLPVQCLYASYFLCSLILLIWVFLGCHHQPRWSYLCYIIPYAIEWQQFIYPFLWLLLY